MSVKLTPFRIEDYLDSPEMIAAYVEACEEEGMEPQLFRRLCESMEQMGEITRAQGAKLV